MSQRIIASKQYNLKKICENGLALKSEYVQILSTQSNQVPGIFGNLSKKCAEIRCN